MDLQAYIKDRTVVDANGCWIWQGAKNQDGYGLISYRLAKQDTDGQRRVHRLAYLAFIGPIPANYGLDHLCRQRACANPAHLEPVTSPTNTLRGNGLTAVKASQTHCLRGHAFDLMNTRFIHSRFGSIWRSCKACERLRANHRITLKAHGGTDAGCSLDGPSQQLPVSAAARLGDSC